MSERNEPKTRGKRAGGSGKWSKYQPHANDVPPSWAEVDDTVLMAAISGITDDGGAVVLGKSRDGGTLVFTLCEGEDRQKFYARNADEMSAELRTLIHVAKT